VPAGKIVAVAKNYEDHRKEMAGREGGPGETRVGVPQTPPQVFLKPASCLLADGGILRIPPGVTNVQWETELAVIIGDTINQATEEEAMGRVLGYAVFLDMTARDLQAEAKRAGMPWSLSKGMDGFGPISDVVIATQAPPWDKMELRLLVNGEVRQRSLTSAMIHSVPRVLAHVSRFMTLERGDIVATGTPAGVGPVKKGDTLEAELLGQSRVRVTVE